MPSIYHGKVEKNHNSKDNIFGRNPLFPTSMIVGGRATANLRELIVSRLWLSQMQQFDQYLPPGILHLTYLRVTLSLSRNKLKKLNSFIAKMESQCLCIGCLQLSASISNINNNPELLAQNWCFQSICQKSSFVISLRHLSFHFAPLLGTKIFRTHLHLLPASMSEATVSSDMAW